jgi:hypothetical protein
MQRVVSVEKERVGVETLPFLFVLAFTLINSPRMFRGYLVYMLPVGYGHSS